MAHKTRPRIACFHGSGSNATIFEIQCARLQLILEFEFEFVFFNAPFERDAGPGILPWFQDYGPYKTWFKNRDGGSGGEIGDGGSGGADTENGIERVNRMMREAGEGGEWVAALGFSQGGRVVGGLLKDQEKRKKEGRTDDSKIDFKFGVLCMGSGTPMEGPKSSSTAAVNGKSQPEDGQISVPTLHLHGLKDQFLPNYRRQMPEYYTLSSTTLIEIDYHHAMPWYQGDILKFAGLIRQLHNATKELR